MSDRHSPIVPQKTLNVEQCSTCLIFFATHPEYTVRAHKQQHQQQQQNQGSKAKTVETIKDEAFVTDRERERVVHDSRSSALATVLLAQTTSRSCPSSMRPVFDLTRAAICKAASFYTSFDTLFPELPTQQPHSMKSTRFRQERNSLQAIRLSTACHEKESTAKKLVHLFCEDERSSRQQREKTFTKMTQSEKISTCLERTSSWLSAVGDLHLASDIKASTSALYISALILTLESGTKRRITTDGTNMLYEASVAHGTDLSSEGPAQHSTKRRLKVRRTVAQLLGRRSKFRKDWKKDAPFHGAAVEAPSLASIGWLSTGSIARSNEVWKENDNHTSTEHWNHQRIDPITRTRMTILITSNN